MTAEDDRVEIREAAEETRVEIREAARDEKTARERKRLGWYLLIFIVSILAVSGANIIYTNRVSHKNAQVWCALISTLDSVYTSAPPKTETGRLVAGEIHALYINLDCSDIQESSALTSVGG